MNTNVCRTPHAGVFRRPAFAIFALALLSLASHAGAALVEPSGYTNAFGTQPAAADWATLSVPGTQSDTYDLDTDVNTNLYVTAAIIRFQVVSNANNPPAQLTNAVWSSSGLYVQTKPLNNRYTALMGKFINNTGTNAEQIAVSYQLTMAGATAAEDAGKGTHVYYSLTGLAGSWIPLPTLNNTNVAGSFILSTNVTISWAAGSTLYLLWADDNNTGLTDVANQIDNFSLSVTAGQALALAGTLVSPPTGSDWFSGAVVANATVVNGAPPYSVSFFTNSGVGNTAFSFAFNGTANSPNTLGIFSPGDYNVYAVITDSDITPASITTLTNTFHVADHLGLAITSPADGAVVNNDVSVTAAAAVSGGTAPFSVQFFLDGLSNGPPVATAPFQRNFGFLSIGDYFVTAIVKDVRGMETNTLPTFFHVTGPLSVTLAPTNGAALSIGQSLSLTAAVLGGTSPYNVTFYTNGQPVGSLSAAPFTTNLGTLPVGSYTCYVHVVDSSAPSAQQANSTTNVITITPPTLFAILTAPSAGQIVTAGQPFTLAATALVGAPLTVSNVQFFVDGVSVGVDGTAAYSATNTPALGSHTAYAVAADSLGRQTYTTTNSFTATTPPTAAIVGPTGYTNDFSTQPPAIEWATLSITGTAGDTYVIDNDVNSFTTAAGVILQTTAAPLTPPTQFSNAVWSTAGLYLQTRPTGNRYVVLMGKFVNQTGTNATQINVSYLFSVAAAASVEDVGTRFYYSLTGLTNSWTNVPPLNTMQSVNGSTNMSANIALNWTNGGSLFLAWVDDNGPGQGGQGTDGGNQYDNFSLTVTAGVPPYFAATITTPGNNALFVSGTPITAAAAVASGTSPYTVEYFTNSGAGNTLFASAGSSVTAPYSLSLGTPTPGVYNIYAITTDSSASPATTNSLTNTFYVADPIAFSLTAPADNGTFDNLTPVTGMTMLSGGTAPYSVQFFLDNSPKGAPVTSSPYNHNFGALIVGDHTIRATVTDSKGWVSNTLASTVHITGPVAGTLLPPDGSSFTYGTPLILTGTVAGGVAPYSADFYVNDVLVGSLSAPPFVTNLGILPVGSYAVYVRATDSSSPTPQQNYSATNTITILPNPVTATLTSPTNGQGGTAGALFALAATAVVGAPLTVSSVEFFYDGVSAGVDTNAPYAGSIASPAGGSHTVYAVATDSLGRKGYSATNTATFVTDPLANDNFVNRFALDTPAHVTGANAGAGTQNGEPTFFFNGVQLFQWGATLWWKWTAPFTSTVTIDTIGSSFNTSLGVYVGTAVNGLTAIAQNDNGPGQAAASLVTFTAQAGVEYQIQVGGIRTGGGGGGNIATGNIQLNLTVPAVVNITAPTNGSVYLVGNNIPVSVNASSTASTITKVDLYDGATFVGTSSNAPYTFVVSNAPPGSNSLYAVATDNFSQIITSGVTRVLVANPGITITSPSDDAIFQGTSPITVGVYGLLPSGSITNVNFFVDGIQFGQDGSAPFSAVWSNVVGGSHRLTATGLDDSGNSYVATPVNFGVGQVLVHSNAVWKYLDNGSDQGTAWIAPGFDDNSWASGPAELGYGDSDEATLVGSGPTGAFFATTYFRRAFVATNVAAFTNLGLLIAYDDAAIVYLNGREVYRVGSLPSVVLYDTYTTGAAIEETVETTTISATNLVEGVNVLAVEMHQQAVTSSDISFFLQLVGVPVVVHNVSPLVAITNLNNDQYFVAPASIPISATASDSDGSVAKVEFFYDGVKIGEATTIPYSVAWNNPSVGAHVLTAVATDNQNATTTSTPIPIVVYNALGTPVAAITSPANGAVMEGPTNLLLTATAHAITGVTNVQFFANGDLIGEDATAPYTVVWPSTFLSNGFYAVAFDAAGIPGTSAVVSVTITIPPTNTIAPTIAKQVPLAFATVTNLTNITVTFSERVQGVDAIDFLVNGVPATSVVAALNGSNYVFSFPQPLYGHVDVSFASDHGITDFGFPDNLPFNDFGPDATWSYTLVDTTPPRVAAHVPATGATVTNLSDISVTFSEAVIGIDAADLLVGGVPAFAVSGSGSNYTFSVSQPASGTISITWATNHGIFDLADLPNSFVRTATGNTWTFTLDSRTTFVQSNSTWRFIKGLAEASDPTNAWRQLAFDDSSWSNSAAPFFYGDPYTNFPAGIYGTELTDMRSNYSSIYLRKSFVVQNRSIITNLIINAQSDDGYIAWINGVEVRRYNVPAGEPSYRGIASASVTEQNNNAVYTVATLTNNAVGALVNGVNILAIQAFNSNLTNDNDFGFNAQLYSFLPDTTTTPPRLAFANPVSGIVYYLTNIVVTFSEDVTNVDASDLLVNGSPATSVTTISNSIYSFDFPQPPYGTVSVTWATNHGIMDLDPVPKPFDGTVASAKLTYTLYNPSAPTVVAQAPTASTTVTGLTSIAITFSEPVGGVDASDLLVNGVAASGLTAPSGSNYVFTFPQPAFGAVTVRWATNHGITDLELPSNNFNPAQPGNIWNYTLINPVPTVTFTSPTNGTYILGPANVTLRATATDNDGTIVLVEFFEDNTKIGESATSPYTNLWLDVQLGSHTLRAVATDNSGLMGTSAPVVLNVVTQLPILLVRGPYLQSGSSTGGVVRWRTDQFSDGVVTYGTSLDSMTNVTVDATLTNNHIVRLGGLQPETKYFYAFGSSGQTLAGGTNVGGSNYWFTTAPVPGAIRPTRFWALGDPGTANANQRAVRDSYYNFVANGGRPADLWVMLGDNAYNSGTDTEYQSAVFDMYPQTLRNYFLWPVLGNHESSQSTDSSVNFPYLDIFSTPRNGEAGGLPSGNPKYYSFDYANVHFVALDSMTSGRETNSPMVLWLKDDLAASTQTWTIVYFHHSLYTHGTHNSDTEADLIQMRQNFNPILEANGVDLVLMGHSHVYERSYLLDGHYGLSSTLTASMKIDGGNGREDGGGAYSKNAEGRGVVYNIAGSSGQALGGTLDHPAHVVSLNLLGSLIIDVNSNRLDAMFLTSAGTTNDHYTLVKRAPEPPAEPCNVAAHASTNQIQITWTDCASDELGYRIYRSLDGNNFQLIGTNTANSSSFTDTTVTPGVFYHYVVHSYNAVGNSGGSGANAFAGNNAPLLDVIPDFIADVLHPVVFTAIAGDIDVPANRLAYSIDPSEVTPPSARINTNNGRFFWLPLRANAATTNYFTTRVSDDGTPSLSDSQEFVVVVRDYVELSVPGAVLEVGQQTNIIVELVSSTPLTNLSFNVLLPSSRLTSVTMDNLIPSLASASLNFSLTDSMLLNFAALPGQTIGGTQQLARLNFTAPIGQSSAFVPLSVNGVTALRAQAGLSPSVLLNIGRVVVIDGQPLLDAHVTPRTLTFYGKPGTPYAIQKSSNPSDPTSWVPWRSFTFLGTSQTFDTSGDADANRIFYRAVEQAP